MHESNQASRKAIFGEDSPIIIESDIVGSEFWAKVSSSLHFVHGRVTELIAFLTPRRSSKRSGIPAASTSS